MRKFLVAAFFIASTSLVASGVLVETRLPRYSTRQYSKNTIDASTALPEKKQKKRKTLATQEGSDRDKAPSSAESTPISTISETESEVTDALCSLSRQVLGEAATLSSDELCNLGVHHHKMGGAQNNVIAFKLFDGAAKLGNMGGIFNRGCMYYKGYKGVKTNLKLAFEDFSLAAKHEHVFALYAIGDMYRHGCYFEDGSFIKSEEKAIQCFEGAVQKGCLPAEYDLGCIYWEKGNKEEARRLLSKASASGFEPATHKLTEWK